MTLCRNRNKRPKVSIVVFVDYALVVILKTIEEDNSKMLIQCVRSSELCYSCFRKLPTLSEWLLVTNLLTVWGGGGECKAKVGGPQLCSANHKSANLRLTQFSGFADLPLMWQFAYLRFANRNVSCHLRDCNMRTQFFLQTQNIGKSTKS